MIIPDFISTRQKLITFNSILILLLSLCAVIFSYLDLVNVCEIIDGCNTFICSLLGFTLASFTVFLSNESKIKEMKSFKTEKEIGNKKISLYKLVCVDFSFLLYVETIMCILYFVSKLFNPLCCVHIPKLVADIFNGIYILMFFSCIIMTINTIKDMYNIASKD